MSTVEKLLALWRWRWNLMGTPAIEHYHRELDAHPEHVPVGQEDNQTTKHERRSDG